MISTVSSTEVIGFLLVVIFIAGLTYIFWPALSLSRNELGWDWEQIADDDDNSKLPSDPLLSVIIPAYNEGERLETMLQEGFDYLKNKNCPALSKLKSLSKDAKNTSVEWILVNDGSQDETVGVFRRFADKSKQPHSWKALSLRVNSGKGAAVKAGMQAAQGHYRLFVDADGATQFDCLGDLCQALVTHDAHMALASRTHLQQTQQRSPVRNLLMQAFSTLQFWILFVGTLSKNRITDTQCGFKLFTADAAKICFGSLHLQRWAFDTELVYIGNTQGLTMIPVDVQWTEVDGSKLDTGSGSLARVAVQMLRDMLCVRLSYALGIWRISSPRSAANTNNSHKKMS